ncbi:MAG TPA: endonuclease/exonuclease/phosphatase family protein [Abditibacteriaceae bacterium]|jgi:endonuclease/exonuclease/phosphatase family metal-dependent hydrolase
MRIASFNVENMFSRARALNDDWAVNEDMLNDYNRLTIILQKSVYSAADKQEIVGLLQTLGLSRSDESLFVTLRRNRGTLLKRSTSAPPVVVANGRDDWVGWLELKKEAVDEVATRMTAKVIQDVGADVLAVVEAEDRIALKRFNEQLLEALNVPYHSIMLIDGNDERGIDVGLMTKPGYVIESLVSHVDDLDSNQKLLFSRDCPEFTIRVASGLTVLVLVNHFKSKGFGSQKANDAKRRAQAQRVREIYDLRRSQGHDKIAIVGDLNDTPDREPLKPLLGNGSDLRDIFDNPHFDGDERPGTFGNGNKGDKIDYILLSPELFARMTNGGIERRGVWGGKNGTLFPHYAEMTKDIHAASDHAAIWADLNV